jgi:hypothetical protein
MLGSSDGGKPRGTHSASEATVHIIHELFQPFLFHFPENGSHALERIPGCCYEHRLSPEVLRLLSA